MLFSVCITHLTTVSESGRDNSFSRGLKAEFSADFVAAAVIFQGLLSDASVFVVAGLLNII